MALPKDTFMLYSAVNMLLRDRYTNLDDLCRDEDIDRTTLETKLHDAGFDFDAEENQFR